MSCTEYRYQDCVMQQDALEWSKTELAGGG